VVALHDIHSFSEPQGKGKLKKPEQFEGPENEQRYSCTPSLTLGLDVVHD
jgi:hypothetical protein